MCRSSSPARCCQAAPRELDVPTSHADLIPTLLGLAGIDPARRSPSSQADHTDARPLVGRDLSDAIRAAEPAAPSEPVLFMTDDEISEGSVKPAQPVHERCARFVHLSRPSSSPTTSRPSSPRSTSTASSTSSSSPATTTTSSSGPCPASATSGSTAARRVTVTEPEPDEYELYDLTLDPYEQRNLAHPSHADDAIPRAPADDARAPHRAARRQAPHPDNRRATRATGPRPRRSDRHQEARPSRPMSSIRHRPSDLGCHHEPRPADAR